MEIPGAAIHSSLDLFHKPNVLVSFENAFEQETLPQSNDNGQTLEFVLTTDRNIYLDLQSIELKVTATIQKGNNGQTVLETNDPITLANNTLHTLFSNCAVYLNNELIHSSNNLYAHRAFIETELSHTKGTNDTIALAQGYLFEQDPNTAADNNEDKRKAWTAVNVDQSRYKTFYGKLAVDFLACDQLLIPNSTLRIRLTRSTARFALIGTVDTAVPIVSNASLFARYLQVSETVNIQTQPILQ